MWFESSNTQTLTLFIFIITVLINSFTSKNTISGINEVILYLNEKSQKQFKLSTKKTKDLILARENEGWGQSDFIKVIDNKINDWKDDPAMDKYLRPETLFSNKFEGYLNEKIIPKKIKPVNPGSINVENMDHTKSIYESIN